MSFSMAAPPPPMPSPPLPTIALAPPPSNLTLSERRAQRQRQRATLPSQLPSDLATPASLLFHHQDARFLDPQLSSLSSGGAPYYTHARSQEDDTASVISAACSSFSPTATAAAAALPRLKSPLPPHYRYPSPAPSFASSVSSTAASTSTCASASTTSSNTSASSASSGHSKNFTSFGHRRRKTITAADDPVLVIGRSDSAATVTPVLVSPPSTASVTTAPSTASLSKHHTSGGRGRSISRSVRKVASVFNLLKREDAVSIPTVPELPTGYRS